MGARFAVSEACLFYRKLHPIAVAEGLGRDGVDLRGRVNLAEAAQLFDEYRALGDELVFIGSVLVVSAAAAAEHGTRREHAVGGGLEHFEHTRAHQARLLLLGARADALAGKHERREHDTAIQASESIAAVDKLLHPHFEIAYDKSYSRTLLP